MQKISLIRFDALVGLSRDPIAYLFCEEVVWFEHASGRVVGTIIFNRHNNDYIGLVLAQDQQFRFDVVAETSPQTTLYNAKNALQHAMDQTAAAPPVAAHVDSDACKKPVDFFRFKHPRKFLDPNFVLLAEQEGYSPARQIIAAMMRWYEDADGNYIEQLQTTGFNQRIWELYLYVSFIEMGYQLDRSDPAPDFVCKGFNCTFAVEAVTVGPTIKGGVTVPPPPTDTPESLWNYVCEYMPIKFGSALLSKLKKAYWKLPNAAGRPLILAIEDFSSPGSMEYTRAGLSIYLYGYAHNDWEHDEHGNLSILPRKIETHRWGSKVIPSGFFQQPNSEKISAVMFSNSGTISKFNRMGILAGFGSSRVLISCQGTKVALDRNATIPDVFYKIVNASDYHESWSDGLDVFHNPRAEISIEENCIPGAAHHYIEEDGQIYSNAPETHPLITRTTVYCPVDVNDVVREFENRPIDLKNMIETGFISNKVDES